MMHGQALARVSHGVSDDGTTVRFDLATFDGSSFTFYCNDEAIREFLRGVSGGVDEMKLRLQAAGSRNGRMPSPPLASTRRRAERRVDPERCLMPLSPARLVVGPRAGGQRLRLE
jgi:hypothetical protein